MEIDFETKMSEACKKIEQKGIEYAKHRAISWQLQELRKVVLAEEIRKLDAEVYKSMAERESLARVSEIYKNHLKGTSEAIEKELISKAEYERWYATFEALRSLCSKNTAQMKLV